MGVLLLILMNIGVMATIYLTIFILTTFFGIQINDKEISGLLILSVIVGFSGSFISLLLSKWMAKKTFDIRIIEEPTNDAERWLLNTVKELSEKANIPMPEVGVFDGPVNAFATGSSKRNSLVAVSLSLIDLMDEKEIKGVLAHEISHIKHGDMVTMTLLQGVLNSFVFFLSRLISNLITPTDKEGNRNEFLYMLISFGLEIVLTLFASIIAMAYSRYREYKADAGAVKIDGPEGIYNALVKLGSLSKEQVALPKQAKAFGIVSIFDVLFSTHPPIEKRLENIKKVAQIN